MRNLALFVGAALLMGGCARSTPAPIAYGADPYEKRLYYPASATTAHQSTARHERPHRSMPLGGSMYVVQKGDTLHAIARKLAATPKAIAGLNRLEEPYPLEVGQRLRVPPIRHAAKGPTKPLPVEKPKKFARPHTVQKGETLYAIARANNVDMYQLAKVNNLSEPYALSAGQALKLPGSAPAAVQVAQKEEKSGGFWPWSKPEPAKDDKKPTTIASKNIVLPQPAPRTSSRFAWPLHGAVKTGFGMRADGQQTDGIHITAQDSAPVRAAENGVVAYADSSIRGYGNMVLIKHSGGWITTYAQNKSLLVKQGDSVKRGQIVARSGDRGYIHFEVRKGKTPVNPLSHLEQQQVADAR